MKAYLINGDIIFTEGNFDSCYLIEERTFSENEMTFPKLDYGKIVVDTVKKADTDAKLLPDARRRKKLEIAELTDAIADDAVLMFYPRSVQLSFSAKEAEARNFLSSTVISNCPMLVAEARIKFATSNPDTLQLTQLAERIVVNANSYKALVGTLSGKSSELCAMVDSMTYDEIIALDVGAELAKSLQ